VVLLALHMTGGVRLLLIEFGSASGLRKNWIAGAIGFAAAAGMAFALSLIA
jgi:fumarate reductase subunit D